MGPLPCAPAEPTLTREVLWAERSRTKTSVTPFVSPLTRLAAEESKATYRPVDEIAGLPLVDPP